MQRRGIVNSLVAAVAILITGGMAAQAVIRGPSSSVDSRLVAAGVDGRDSVAVESPAVTAAARASATTLPRPRPRPTPVTPATAPAPATTVTTDSTPPETTIPAPDPGPLPTLPAVVQPPPSAPPVVVQTGAASWRFEDKGVTITASVSPVAPRVGDTVTISFTTGGEPVNCCRGVAFVGTGVDMKMVGYTLRSEADPCQPAGPVSGTGSLVVTDPGPLTFDVEATRDPTGCDGPVLVTNVALKATVQVLPALPAPEPTA